MDDLNPAWLIDWETWLPEVYFLYYLNPRKLIASLDWTLSYIIIVWKPDLFQQISQDVYFQSYIATQNPHRTPSPPAMFFENDEWLWFYALLTCGPSGVERNRT